MKHGNLSEQTQKNFKVIMQKLMKMQEYNEISDMTNQVFEMRLSNIEDFLFRLDNYLRNKKRRIKCRNGKEAKSFPFFCDYINIILLKNKTYKSEYIKNEEMVRITKEKN